MCVARSTAQALVSQLRWLQGWRISWTNQSPLLRAANTMQCSFSGGVGLFVYGLIAAAAKVPEAQDIGRQLRARLPGRG